MLQASGRLVSEFPSDSNFPRFPCYVDSCKMGEASRKLDISFQALRFPGFCWFPSVSPDLVMNPRTAKTLLYLTRSLGAATSMNKQAKASNPV